MLRKKKKLSIIGRNIIITGGEKNIHNIYLTRLIVLIAIIITVIIIGRILVSIILISRKFKILIITLIERR